MLLLRVVVCVEFALGFGLVSFVWACIVVFCFHVLLLFVVVSLCCCDVWFVLRYVVEVYRFAFCYVLCRL